MWDRLKWRPLRPTSAPAAASTCTCSWSSAGALRTGKWLSERTRCRRGFRGQDPRQPAWSLAWSFAAWTGERTLPGRRRSGPRRHRQQDRCWWKVLGVLRLGSGQGSTGYHCRRVKGLWAVSRSRSQLLWTAIGCICRRTGGRVDRRMAETTNHFVSHDPYHATTTK